MVTSQNGFPANDRSQITTYLVGAKTKFALRKGSPGWLLAHFASWFDANIKDIDAGAVVDDWSYAERPIRGGIELSNHASGTAIDVDATRWPLGVEPESYLTKAEITRVRQQLLLYEGCIRWGGDYTGRKDPMHFEVNRDEAACDRVQTKLLGRPQPATSPTQEDDDMLMTFRRDPLLKDPSGKPGTGEIAVIDRGIYYTIPTVGHYQLMVGRKFVRPLVNVPNNEFDYFRDVALSGERNDEEALARLKKLEQLAVAPPAA